AIRLGDDPELHLEPVSQRRTSDRSWDGGGGIIAWADFASAVATDPPIGRGGLSTSARRTGTADRDAEFLDRRARRRRAERVAQVERMHAQLLGDNRGIRLDDQGGALDGNRAARAVGGGCHLGHDRIERRGGAAALELL